MLIIFDLDDTLIDTSGSVTPYKCERALYAMLGRPPERGELLQFLEMNEKLGSSKAAIENWARKKGVSPDKGIFEMRELLPDGFPVSRTIGAKEILEEYGKAHPLALVTIGHPPFQLDKLKKAGIEASIFSKILIQEGASKKLSYEALRDEFSSGEIWVCGDRIETDLLPAHELGLHTVHMRWGRGKGETKDWIEHSISTLLELRNILG